MTVSLDIVLMAAVALASGLALGWWLGSTRAGSRVAVAEAALDHERQSAAQRVRDDQERLSLLQAAVAGLERDHKAALSEAAQAREAAARSDAQAAAERRAFDDRLKAYEDAEARLTTAFESLSGKALEGSTKHLLDLAATRFETLRTEAGRDLAIRQTEIAGVVDPMKATLQRVEQTLAAVEQARAEDKGRLSTELGTMAALHQELRDETRRLTRALQVPHVRGRWGEMQLQRVVELAGMDEHCDFRLQPSLGAEDGGLRPDMIVTLPGGRSVVVDAKAPVSAYLDAMNLEDAEARNARLRDHAALVRTHVNALGAKQYWDRLECTPDFVVLFLPGESFFSSAVQQDPGLFEHGVRQRVFLAGPFTLLALLRAVAHGWNQQRLAENARAISELGRELYERVSVMAEHFVDLRRKLQGTVEAHNAAVASLESRVLPSARKFRDLGIASSKEVEPLAPVEQTPRRIQAPELTAATGARALDAEIVADTGDGAGALEPSSEE